MKNLLLNILAIVLGVVIGGYINMQIIFHGTSIIPAPAGADVTTTEGLKAALHLFTPINYIMPFLAHALGTLVGALIAYLIAAKNKMRIALTIGAIFLVRGIMSVIELPAAIWFSVLDLVAAYFPFAFIAAKLGGFIQRNGS